MTLTSGIQRILLLPLVNLSPIPNCSWGCQLLLTLGWMPSVQVADEGGPRPQASPHMERVDSPVIFSLSSNQTRLSSHSDFQSCFWEAVFPTCYLLLFVYLFCFLDKPHKWRYFLTQVCFMFLKQVRTFKSFTMLDLPTAVNFKGILWGEAN